MSYDDIGYDPFAGSSGLADNIDVTFTEVRFIKDPQYTNDAGEMMPVFAADLVTDDPDAGTDGTLENQFFSIGSGWEIEDNGAKVVRAPGKKGGFNHSVYLQVVLAKLLELDEDAVRSRYEDTGFTPMDAGYWEGLKVHMVQEQYTTGGFKGSEKRTRDRLMPTEILGWGVEEAKPAKAAAKKAPAKKAAVKAAGKPKPPAKEAPAADDGAADEPVVDETLTAYAQARAQVPAELVTAIESIAAEANEPTEFIDRCYSEVEGLDEDDNAMYLVDNVDAEDSIWGLAVAAAS